MSFVQTRIVSTDEAGLRLDRWFSRHFPDVTHIQIEKMARTGQIRVDGRRVKANDRLKEGQSIRVPPMPRNTSGPERGREVGLIDPQEAQMLRDAVLYMDEDVIVLNKPPGLAVQGGTNTDRHLDGMLEALRFDATERPRLVHRLDKDTSGVLLLGRSVTATAKLAAAFRSREARKLYWALVAGIPKLRQGRIDAPLSKLPGRLGDKVAVDQEEGKRAVTWYRVVDAVLRRAAWLEMEPRTGRTHQLRAHCLLLGTPIVGDGKYGGEAAKLEGFGLSRKMHLHARALTVPHPRGGMLSVEAPLPSHMQTSFTFFDFKESQAGKPFAAFDDELEQSSPPVKKSR